MQLRVLALPVLACAALSAQADVSVTSSSFSYAQNFNTLGTHAADTGNGGTIYTNWVNNSTIQGWSWLKSDGTGTTSYIADASRGGYGALAYFHALGAAGSTDRSMGILTAAGDDTTGFMALSLKNNSGSSLGSFTLGYAGEQWRQGTSNMPNMLTVEYGFGSSFTGVTNWTAAGAGFNFSTPVQGGTTVASVDGNAAGYVSGLGGTVSGLNWNNGDTLWIRWTALATDQADSMGIDDVTLSVAAAVPEPSSYALMLAGLGAVGLLLRRRRSA